MQRTPPPKASANPVDDEDLSTLDSATLVGSESSYVTNFEEAEHRFALRHGLAAVTGPVQPNRDRMIVDWLAEQPEVRLPTNVPNQRKRKIKFRPIAEPKPMTKEERRAFDAEAAERDVREKRERRRLRRNPPKQPSRLTGRIRLFYTPEERGLVPVDEPSTSEVASMASDDILDVDSNQHV
ncbi:hypothetical protein VNI00_014224 [Paramarasmius palmivorus]|uniref:Uncharacterized protein n=1 Tax=Paramarasmius palmivorus TaxID=297713 RepID=A0AAW0BTY7_9AGAR